MALGIFDIILMKSNSNDRKKLNRLKGYTIMTDPKIITVGEIGEVLFERSFRAKYVNITIRPFNGIRVAVPVGVSLAAARKITESKTEWIKMHLFNNKQLEREYNELISNKKPLNRADAKKKIIRRLEELSVKHKIPFNKVFIRAQKTRWGSCSVKKNISLNINIARLPHKLMDYVILHELVHIRHNNHGEKYWQELSRIAGDAKSLDKKLDIYQPLLD